MNPSNNNKPTTKKAMKIINLTPHEVKIQTQGTEMVIPPCGTVARCAITEKIVYEINGIPIYRTEAGKVEGLPEPENETLYIVSQMVANAAKNRGDLVYPHKLIRNEKGEVVGCSALGTVYEESK